MIADPVGKIQAIEQQLTEKTRLHLLTRPAIRACLKERREIRGRVTLEQAPIHNQKLSELSPIWQ
jgi:hypothetical protein